MDIEDGVTGRFAVDMCRVGFIDRAENTIGAWFMSTNILWFMGLCT